MSREYGGVCLSCGAPFVADGAAAVEFVERPRPRAKAVPFGRAHAGACELAAIERLLSGTPRVVAEWEPFAERTPMGAEGRTWP